MFGEVYFVDGHTEEVVNYELYDDDALIFKTQNALYGYKESIDGLPFQYKFYKCENNRWLVTDTISCVQIKER